MQRVLFALDVSHCSVFNEGRSLVLHEGRLLGACPGRNHCVV